MMCRVVLAVGALLLLAAPVRGADLKLWPLVDYHSGDGGVKLHLLGPLISYERDADSRVVALRPLFYWKQRWAGREGQLAFLYPFAISRWDEKQTSTRLLGLFAFQTTSPPAPAQWERRFTLFPLVFYRHSEERGTSLSVLPFYADLHNFFGYRRVRMIAFPLYLSLEQPLVERSWLPFPFVSWTKGAVARGWRVWPLYGWEVNGESERFHYVLWPFYIRQELHWTRPEREVRVVYFPWYSRRDAPAVHTWAAFGPFFTHTIDRTKRTDTWGFPWPLWVSQRDLDTGERTTLRLVPFYENRNQGDLQAQFYLWPAYRHRLQETADYRYERYDAGLILWRWIEETQSTRDHRRHRHTLFPLFWLDENDGEEQAQSLGLLDALVPSNRLVREIYSPLWRVWGYRRPLRGPAQWSLAWDLLSSDGARVRYPVYLRVGD